MILRFLYFINVLYSIDQRPIGRYCSSFDSFFVQQCGHHSSHRRYWLNEAVIVFSNGSPSSGALLLSISTTASFNSYVSQIFRSHISYVVVVMKINLHKIPYNYRISAGSNRSCSCCYCFNCILRKLDALYFLQCNVIVVNFSLLLSIC